jgi:hypothetical protein
LPDIIKLGVDVLNFQASVMDMNELSNNAGIIAFRTDINHHKVLLFGSPSEVKDYDLTLFHQLGT